jgi:hypothetical protein
MLEIVLLTIPTTKTKVLYTNGLLLTQSIATRLERCGLNAINIGIHNIDTFSAVEEQVLEALKFTKIKPRFHVWDKYTIANHSNHSNIKYWKLDDCDRTNEERLILEK